MQIYGLSFPPAGNGPCLGYRKPGRPYQWLTYKQVRAAVKKGKKINERCWPLPQLSLKVADRAERLGSGLLHRGLKPSPDTFIGIFAQNRPEVSGGIRIFIRALWRGFNGVFGRLPLSGLLASWPVTPSPWWPFPCMTLWVLRPWSSLSTKVIELLSPWCW